VAVADGEGEGDEVSVTAGKLVLVGLAVADAPWFSPTAGVAVLLAVAVVVAVCSAIVATTSGATGMSSVSGTEDSNTGS
jgi:hypothetical protein